MKKEEENIKSCWNCVYEAEGFGGEHCGPCYGHSKWVRREEKKDT